MKRITILVLITILFAFNANSQDKGEINGRVTDKLTQQPLPGAVIEIVQLKLKTGSNDDGYFVLPDVPSGIYSVRFSYIGYIPLVKDFISVNSGNSLNLLAEL
jgi:hypothetical protein